MDRAEIVEYLIKKSWIQQATIRRDDRYTTDNIEFHVESRTGKSVD